MNQHPPANTPPPPSPAPPETTPTRDFLPFHRPTLGPAEEAAVLEVLRSGWLTTGARTKAFEAAFAELVGVEHAIALSSCTAALHLALRLIEVGPGDEVLVPTTTFAATANVVVHLGARPVLCDVDPVTLTLDPAAAAARITARTRAIVPVHLGGYPAPMPALLDLAARHRLHLIEDAAHAIETEMAGKHAGAHGICGAFSFYPTKSITTGEGGMLTTDQADLAARGRILALHGLSQDAWKRYTKEGSAHYDVIAPGFKYNLTDLAAAIGLVQLERLASFYAARAKLARAYAAALGGLPVTWQPLDVAGGRAAHHLFILLLDRELAPRRDELVLALKARQIGTSIHFRPLHLMPFYAETYGYRPEDLPVAADVYARTISLPLYPAMTEADVEYVADALRALLG